MTLYPVKSFYKSLKYDYLLLFIYLFSNIHVKENRNLDKTVILLITDSIISTRKTISASSTSKNWQPSNAVDGVIRTNDPNVCLCCAATQAGTDPWLKLDLGDTFFITFIKLYGRTDRTPSPRKFIIKISV